MLPLPGKPLHAKLYGPYRVMEKLGPVDYRIEIPDRRKKERICHVNLLKPYRRRGETQFPKSVVPVGIVTSSPCEDFGETIPAIGEWKQSNEFVPELTHLTTHQQQQLNIILATYSDIFKDTPGRTTMCTHHIRLIKDAKPIASPPYRLNREKKSLVKKELEEMLQMSIIEEIKLNIEMQRVGLLQ